MTNTTKQHTSTKPLPYRRLPGHVLVEEFLVPYFPADLGDLAFRAKIPVMRLRKLIRGQDRIDARMAEALGTFYQNGAEFWLDLQARFERGEKL
jgi:plasmid maintenance system antidote protein VapI